MKRKKNDWFLTVFLPSIFQRAGSNRSMWLTQKQTAIIVDNSEEHTARTLDADGIYYCNRLYYTGRDITGREYHMTYSKLNGCGYITFYLNDEEAEAQRIKNEQEQRTKKQERMIKRKANPERRAKSIERLKREIEETNHSIQYFLEELSEEDIPPEDKKLTRKVLKVKRNELKELEADLNFYLS